MTIEPAWLELRTAILKMRPDWTELDVDAARAAAGTAAWEWPKFALEVMRLATDSDAQPRDLVARAANPVTGPAGRPGDWEAGAAACRAGLEHRATVGGQ